MEEQEQLKEEIESQISSILSKTRDQIGNFLIHNLSTKNHANIMAMCGSKGSVLNIC